MFNFSFMEILQTSFSDVQFDRSGTTPIFKMVTFYHDYDPFLSLVEFKC